MGDVARALKRPPQYTTKWFGNELGAQSTYTNKEGEGERSIVNGAHDTGVFQTLLDKFIEKYVCCENCHLPEIDMFIKKGNITKNPPDESGLNIVAPGAETGKKMGKE